MSYALHIELFSEVHRCVIVFEIYFVNILKSSITLCD